MTEHLRNRRSKGIVPRAGTVDNTSVKHYEHAPITEAIIDVLFAGPSTTSDELSALQRPESSAYPEKKPLFMASFKLDSEVPPGELPAFTDQLTSQRGWAFVAADKQQVWQVRHEGFTFSRLAPYQSWHPFRDEARRLWDVTRESLRPEKITRVAVRTINRLELPLPFADFKDYLRVVPEISPDLPQALNTFLMQMQVPLPELKATLMLTQHLQPQTVQRPSGETAVVVLLDIDLSKDADLPQDEGGLWELLEVFHGKRNEFFEGCITDRTRDLIR